MFLKLLYPALLTAIFTVGASSTITPAQALEWAKLPAWGIITIGGGMLLKFTLKDLRDDLKNIADKLETFSNKLDRLVELMLSERRN